MTGRANRADVLQKALDNDEAHQRQDIYQEYKKQHIAAHRLSSDTSQRDILNKIECLRDKWKRQAIDTQSDRQPVPSSNNNEQTMLNYEATSGKLCDRSGKYLKANLAEEIQSIRSVVKFSYNDEIGDKANKKPELQHSRTEQSGNRTQGRQNEWDQKQNKVRNHTKQQRRDSRKKIDFINTEQPSAKLQESKRNLNNPDRKSVKNSESKTELTEQSNIFETEIRAGESNAFQLVTMRMQSPAEQTKKLHNPVVWLMSIKQSVAEREAHLKDDATNRNNRSRRRRTTDNQFVSSATSRSTPIIRKNSGAAYQRLESSTDPTMMALKTSDSENDVNAQCDIAKEMRSARVSRTKPTIYHRIKILKQPEVRMHSNSMRNRSLDEHEESDNEQELIHGAEEISEESIENVTRLIQAEVKRVAQRIAAEGLANLVGARKSKQAIVSTAKNIEETQDSTTDDKEFDRGLKNKERMNSFEELDESKEYDTNRGYRKNRRKLSAESESGSFSPALNKDCHRGGWQQSKGGSRDQWKASPNRWHQGSCTSQSHRQHRRSDTVGKLLPMEHCPTTRHSIECFKTRSGKFKCYMTARHPVKCHVENGRILCKPTINAYTSDLPSSCTATWL